MPLTKQQKQDRVERLRADLAQAKAVVVTGFDRLTVAQDFELRRRMRSVGARYRVVKNTLAARAAEGTPLAAVLGKLKGVNSIAYTGEDGVALAKALQKYIQDNPALAWKSGFADGQPLTAREIGVLAALPGKQELYAKLLFLIQAPAQRLVTVLSAPGRDLAVVLDQAVKANKFR